MKKDKRIIYHFPGVLPSSMEMGSKIRPQMMLKAFKKMGYDIELIEGSYKERKRKINDLKYKINNGNKYLYAYSESSWLPTLLSDGNKIPRFPLLDYQFFRLCNQKKIKLGLFYRDIYWRFDGLKLDQNLTIFKRLYIEFFYYLDILVYNLCVNILFIPSIQMKNYIPMLKINCEPLPPAMDYSASDFTPHLKNHSFDPLNILYVGGLARIYRIDKLIEVTSNLPFVSLTICTPKENWENEKFRYDSFLNDSIKIEHKSGDELLVLFKQAHIAAMFYEPNVYRTFLRSIKLFQFIEQQKPIIATVGS